MKSTETQGVFIVDYFEKSYININIFYMMR